MFMYNVPLQWDYTCTTHVCRFWPQMPTKTPPSISGRSQRWLISDFWYFYFIFLLHLLSSGCCPVHRLSWTSWTCQGSPTSPLYPSPFLDVAASTRHHHALALLLLPVQQALLPPPAGPLFQGWSKGNLICPPPHCCWEIGEKVSFSVSYEILLKIKKHSNLTWLISIKYIRNNFSVVKLGVFRICAW